MLNDFVFLLECMQAAASLWAVWHDPVLRQLQCPGLVSLFDCKLLEMCCMPESDRDRMGSTLLCLMVYQQLCSSSQVSCRLRLQAGRLELSLS